MSPRVPRNVIATTPGGDLTLDMVIGFYVLSVIPDAGVSVARLRKAWRAAGLDPDLIPKNRKAVHAFQVACRSVETRRQVAENGDKLRTTEVRVEQVLENDDECVYQVTHLVRDTEQRIIEHPKAMRVIFSKTDESITWDPLDGVLSGPALHDLGERITAHFEENANKITGYQVRDAVRRTLEGVHATKIANGKAWFVPKGGQGALEDLQTALGDTYRREDFEFHSIPLASTKGQKELIERHFTANVKDRISGIIVDINGRIDRGDEVLRKDKMASLMRERAEAVRMVDRYKDILDLSLIEADEQVQLLNERLEELVNQTGSAGRLVAAAA